MNTDRRTPAQWLQDRIREIQAARAGAQGLDEATPGVTAPPGTPGSTTVPMGPPPPATGSGITGGATEPATSSPPPAGALPSAPSVPETPEETARKADARVNDQNEYPYPLTTTVNLERLYNALRRAELIRDGWVAQANNPPRLKSGAVDATAQTELDNKAKAAEVAAASALNAATAEQNRVDAKAEADKKTKDTQPKNGDTKTVRVEHKGISGTVTQTYNNGVWSDDPNSFKVDSSFPNNTGPAVNRQVLTDGQGGYWTFDPATGKTEKLSGLAGKGDTVVTLGDGTSWLAGPDGKPRTKLTEAKPTTNVVDNFLVMTDPMSGKVITRLDLLDPAQRERATKLADLAVKQGEEALQPKFTDAGAQYTQEASRRQALARQELERLTKLQQEGQISPEQAEQQFDAWMKVNVEGPLAGYKRAADEERRAQEQANLDRTTAEQSRVDALNRQRDTMAFQAGEAGRQEGIEIGKQTRAPEFISDLGGLANSLASGKTDFQFSPGSFDVANYRKVVPNLNELADAAINRLFARVPAATANPNVNVPLRPPVGPDLIGAMNNVRYSGPMTNAPTGEQPLPGQGALDQGNGMARSVYSNGRYVDWAIPQGPAAPAAAAAPAAPTPGGPGLAPGQLPGETLDQMRARFYGGAR